MECKRTKQLSFNEGFANLYLTATEFNILKKILIASERAVARELGISRNSVSTHIQNIRRKFNCNTIIELRKLVIASGLASKLFMDEQ